MLQAFIDLFTKFIPSWLTVFVISMMPILELRGGLIASSILGIPWFRAAVICIIGTILPVPVILLFVRKALAFLGSTKTFGNLARRYEGKALSGGARLMEKYPGRVQLALLIFVAIPLPGTGAWTGSLIAAFLGLPFKRTFLSVALGTLAAACIMLLLSYAFPAAMGLKGN